MDDATFNDLLAGLDQKQLSAPQQPQPQAPTAPTPAQPTSTAPSTVPPSTTSPPAPIDHTDPNDPTMGGMFPAGGQMANPNAPANKEPGLSDPSSPFVEAPVAGGAKAVYETKDFVFGETPKDQRSSIRRAIEAGPNADNSGLGYSLSEGLSQFAVGMLGAGKIMKAAEGVSAVGGAVEAFKGVRGGAVALESAKAATVGAIAFDPHAQRLSNLVQEVPSLANPINGFLAAKPDDSAATGRLKNAMESIGLDATMIGMLTGGAAIMRAMKSGDVHAIDAASAETQAALDGHTQQAQAREAAATAPASPAGGIDPNGLPELTVTPKPPQEPPTAASSGGGGDASTPTPSPTPEPEVHTDVAGREFTKAAPGEPWLEKPAEAPPSRDLSGDEQASVEDAMAKAMHDPEAPSPAAPEVEQVQSPTAGAGPDGLPPKPQVAGITDEQMSSILQGIGSDLDAFTRFGDWDTAVDNGHIFGKGGSIPYQKLVGGQNELGAFITRNAKALKGQLDAAKGGEVLSDARVDRLVQQRVQLYGEDPAALYGIIQKAGKDANSLVANMEASYAVAQRGYQDSFALAQRIKIGALDEFGGSHAAAMDALKQQLEVASSAWGAGQAMRSASGRALRRMRSEFRVDQSTLDALKSVGDEELVNMLNTTGGDPRLLRTATQPALLNRTKDWAQFLYVNNLLWGLKTHFINFSSNAALATIRPMERVLGSMAMSFVKGGDEAADALRIRQESLRQYTYMGASLMDSWKDAYETWRTGDSVLAPHTDERLNQGVDASGGQPHGINVATVPWKPWTSMSNVLENTLTAVVPKTLGFPTRAIGTADEMIKQVVYRSTIQAKAHVEGLSQGLEGNALSGYVRNRLFDSFDDAGRAVDASALQEARVITSQQDLLPGTFGAALQHASANATFIRFIVPFVKTPTNLIRTGIKMTPGLNLVQEEYRQMLTGALGPEQQAQAVGQMGMGALYLGTAAYLAHAGYITGGGPSDPKARNALMAANWRPYSFVIPRADGSKAYLSYGRYDPMAMPFGMVADVIDVMSQDQDSRMIQKSGTMAQAVLIGLVKSISQKSYLKSLDDTIQAITAPEDKAIKFLGTFAANMVPASSLLRQVNPDPSLRDSRNFLDYVKATIPGFSQTLPPKRDAFGDPESVHKGLWVDSPSSLVDSEVRRMGEKPGQDHMVGPPSASFKGGVDLRDVTMADGSNAYDKLQQYARQPGPHAKPIKDVVARVMQTPAYKDAPDGDPATPATKLYMVTKTMAGYRAAAERMMQADPNVRAASYKKIMEVKSAYANRKSNQNPTTANKTGDALTTLQKSFGAMAPGLVPPPPQQ